MQKTCYQINLQTGFGGGEVYTRFFTRALLELGWKVILLAPAEAAWWRGLEQEGAVIVPLARGEDIAAHLPQTRSLLVFQTPVGGSVAERLRQRHFVTCFAHMPLYGRNPEAFRHYDLLFAVSAHVIASLKAADITHFYPEPLYGVADLERPSSGSGALCAHSVYDWDQRKFRDRFLNYIYPLYFAFKPARVFEKREGLTLGIVSRLTPIKQFPLLFEILAPVLQSFPQVKLEIFGSGGYASVRDLKRSLAPISGQVRWWGHQDNVKTVYPLLDFLLTGLPEKEALGLNIIEAQVCGTPVLGVNAPPFTETVAEGETGYLYTDPRQDNGADFARLMRTLLIAERYPEPLLAVEHMAKFSYPTFLSRVGTALTHAVSVMGQP